MRIVVFFIIKQNVISEKFSLLLVDNNTFCTMSYWMNR